VRTGVGGVLNGEGRVPHSDRDMAATGAISTNVAALTHGMGQAMLATKFKLVTAVVLMLGTLGLTFRWRPGNRRTTDPIPSPAAWSAATRRSRFHPFRTRGRGHEDGRTTRRRLAPAQRRISSSPFTSSAACTRSKARNGSLMAVRLTNRTDAEIGVDLRGKQPGVNPNQWSGTGHRATSHHRRTARNPDRSDQDQLRADFKAARLDRDPGREIHDHLRRVQQQRPRRRGPLQGKYLIISMAGQVVATDGKTVETASCAWTTALARPRRMWFCRSGDLEGGRRSGPRAGPADEGRE